jgi:hypothetical protein
MSNTVFDRVARDYEKIHNRSLPPGVSSDEFVRQKAEHVVRWIQDNGRQTGMTSATWTSGAATDGSSGF